MKVAVDTNIVFSAILNTNSKNRRYSYELRIHFRI